jgi:hypothetical protein
MLEGATDRCKDVAKVLEETGRAMGIDFNALIGGKGEVTR